MDFNTEEPLDYQNWAEGEPNNYYLERFPNEDCACITPSMWRDYHGENISDLSGYVCEWDSELW